MDLSHMLLEFTDIRLCCNEFTIWGSLFTESRWREGHWYSVNHVSRDYWLHSQSLTEFVNCLHFTGLPVRGSQFAKYPHPTISSVLCQKGLSDISGHFVLFTDYDTTANSTSPVKFLEASCAWKWYFWRLNIFRNGSKLEGYHFCMDVSANAERIQATNGLTNV